MTATDDDLLPPLRVALTFDTDADYFDSSLSETGVVPMPGWRGVAEGIPRMIEELRQLHDSGGNAARATWFVRSDNQLHDLHGSHTYLLERFSSLWAECSAAGDEIAWHPHLYRLAASSWVQETDPDELRRKMTESHAAVCRARGAPSSSRIGEAYCSNAVMEALETLGLEVDSTAMPGRRRVDEFRTIDWEGTPVRPYRPSRADYRVPGNPERSVVEIPMSMVPVRADYDSEPFLRYVDLSFHPRALADGLERHVRSADLLVTMTHPSGVLPDLTDRAHGLISFSLAAFRENLQAILRAAVRCNRELRFVTISECIPPALAS